MKTLFFAIAQISFAMVTLLFYAWTFRTLKNGLMATEFPAERKRKIIKITIMVLGSWLVIVSALSIAGVLSDFSSFPPKFGIVLVLPLVGIVALTFSPMIREVTNHIPVECIIRMQVFRVFVEILLWMLLVEELLPVQMSFEGRNYDILAGLTAPLVAYLYSKNKISRKVAMVWNVVGLILLFNIVTIALLSMPTPLRVFINEPSSIIVTRFPIVCLPAFLVPLAYGLHFLSLRQLMRNK